ncbi:hypothetical protein [Desertibacillus haloalkaliphilus]|uniref:hypothetical protein n=1 Tax=Desertibacillus haloalkaliphilus TaxID=1328930 RepID=UPI001C25A05F|nr:hypothetical protein [Desertibacillus haloalkaliphilus]MBU8908524.1 hypothetical protein [Desertibacillus haloalkaliphilus]
MGIFKFNAAMKKVNKVSEAIGDAKAIKDGEGVQRIGGRYAQKKIGKSFKRFFK